MHLACLFTHLNSHTNPPESGNQLRSTALRGLSVAVRIRTAHMEEESFSFSLSASLLLERQRMDLRFVGAQDKQTAHPSSFEAPVSKLEGGQSVRSPF